MVGEPPITLTLSAEDFSICRCLTMHTVIGQVSTDFRIPACFYDRFSIHQPTTYPSSHHKQQPPRTPIVDSATCIKLQQHSSLASPVCTPSKSEATSVDMSVAPMLNMCSVDAMRHLDNPSTPDLSRTITPDVLPLSHGGPGEFVLGTPADGAIAKRRLLASAIRSLAQRQLRSHHSGILRYERESRSASLERLLDSSSAVTSRRTQQRATTTKRRAIRRVRSRANLSSQRLLAKKASTIGSEMVFFGEFKANPRSRSLLGCVVS
jgi:hypothetical protein